MDGVSYLRRSYGFIFVVKKSFVGIVFDCCSAVEKKSFEIQRYPLSLYVVVLTFVLNFALFYIKLLTIFVAWHTETSLRNHPWSSSGSPLKTPTTVRVSSDGNTSQRDGTSTTHVLGKWVSTRPYWLGICVIILLKAPAMNTLASVVKLMRSSVRIDCDVKVECARRNQRTRKQQLLDISIHYRVTCNALFMNEWMNPGFAIPAG